MPMTPTVLMPGIPTRRTPPAVPTVMMTRLRGLALLNTVGVLALVAVLSMIGVVLGKLHMQRVDLALLRHERRAVRRVDAVRVNVVGELVGGNCVVAVSVHSSNHVDAL